MRCFQCEVSVVDRQTDILMYVHVRQCTDICSNPHTHSSVGPPIPNHNYLGCDESMY